MNKALLVLQHLLSKRSKTMVSEPGRPVVPATPDGFEPLNPKPESLNDPLPTQGVRKPSLKKHKTMRTEAVIKGQVVHSESFLEDKFATRLSAMPDVAKVVSQALKIYYRSPDGKWHFHIIDFLVTFKDGRKLAVLVKQSSKKLTMKELVRCLVETGYVVLGHRRVDVFDVVDRIKVFDEGFGTLEAFDNARWVQWALKKADRRDIDAIRGYLEKLEGRIYFFELLKGADNRSMRRASVWIMIHQGLLRPVTARRIGDHSLLKINMTETNIAGSRSYDA